MMMTVEKAIRNATTVARHSVHQTSVLWALVQAVVRSTIQRCPAVTGIGLPFSAMAAPSPRAAQSLAGHAAIVAPIQMHSHRPVDRRQRV